MSCGGSSKAGNTTEQSYKYNSTISEISTHQGDIWTKSKRRNLQTEISKKLHTSGKHLDDKQKADGETLVASSTTAEALRLLWPLLRTTEGAHNVTHVAHEGGRHVDGVVVLRTEGAALQPLLTLPSSPYTSGCSNNSALLRFKQRMVTTIGHTQLRLEVQLFSSRWSKHWGGQCGCRLPSRCKQDREKKRHDWAVCGNIQFHTKVCSTRCRKEGRVHWRSRWWRWKDTRWNKK